MVPRPTRARILAAALLLPPAAAPAARAAVFPNLPGRGALGPGARVRDHSGVGDLDGGEVERGEFPVVKSDREN